METYDFTDLYRLDNNAGVVITDTADIKSRVEDMMKTVFGADVDVTEETPMGRLVEMITVLMSQTLSINAQNANQFNINLATGVYLDAIGSLFGITRRAATRTRVRVTVTGAQNTVIPISCVAETTEGHKFYPESPISIGSNGKGDGYFVSMETGVVPCDRNTLSIIVSGTLGWETVNNDTDTATIYGTMLETDASYRERILASRASGSSSIAAITNAIYNSDSQITSAYVLENGYSQPIVKRGITIPAHSIFVCVYGGNDDAIAKAIFNTKTAGAGYTYSAGAATLKTIEVEDKYTGQTYRVFFFRPIETTLSFNVVVDRHLYAGTNLETDVKNAINEYCQQSGIGSNVTREAAVAYIANKIPSIRIVSLSVGYTGSEPQDSIPLSANRIPTTSDTNITVTET